jgi:dethiobiotin synthetase
MVEKPSRLAPRASRRLGLFIAGTGTAVGKTHVAAMIARELVGAGRLVGVYKPAASGCRREGGVIVADDAVQLWDAAGRPGDLERVCPQRFVAPLAPPRAAQAEARTVDSSLLRAGLEYWTRTSEIVLVEGAGGLLSPLGDDDYNIDLAAEFGYPLVIVAANELGVINATLQTVLTARARAAQLPIAGIVLNQANQRDGDVSLASNAEEIAGRTAVPLLATLHHGETAFPAPVDWRALASGSWPRSPRYHTNAMLDMAP